MVHLIWLGMLDIYSWESSRFFCKK